MELNRQKPIAQDLQFHMSRCHMCISRGLSLTTGKFNFQFVTSSICNVLCVLPCLIHVSALNFPVIYITGANVHVTRFASLLSYLCKDQEAGGSRLCSTATPMSARMVRSSLSGIEEKTFRLFWRLLIDCMIWTGLLVRRRMSAQQRLDWSGC